MRHALLVWSALMVIFAVLPLAWLFGSVSDTDVSLVTSLAHFAEFGCFTILAALTFRETLGVWRGLAAAAVAAIVFAVVTEMLQLPLPYRSFDVRDLYCDWAGAATAVLVLSVAYRRAEVRSAPCE